MKDTKKYESLAGKSFTINFNNEEFIFSFEMSPFESLEKGIMNILHNGLHIGSTFYKFDSKTQTGSICGIPMQITSSGIRIAIQFLYGIEIKEA